MGDPIPRLKIFQSEQTEPGHALIQLGGVERAPLGESFSVARAAEELIPPGSNWPTGLRSPISSAWFEERHVLELVVGPDIVNPIQGGTPVLLRFPGLGREEMVIWPDDLLLQPEGTRLWRRPDRKALRAQVVTPVQTRPDPVRRAEPPKPDDVRRRQQETDERLKAEEDARNAEEARLRAEKEQARKQAEEEEARKKEAEEGARRDEDERRTREELTKKDRAAKAKDDRQAKPKRSLGLAMAAAVAGLVLGAGGIEAWHQLGPKPAEALPEPVPEVSAAKIAEVLCVKPGEDRRRALERLLTMEEKSPGGIPAEPLTIGMVQRLAHGSFEGTGGQSRNHDEALFWARQLAKRGRYEPFLGELYRTGTPRQRPDLQLAELSWQLAATAGSGQAMLYLGKFYENGACGTESRTNAEFWYGLAARDPDAKIREAAIDGRNRIALEQ